MSEKIRLGRSAHALNDAVAAQNREIFSDANLTVFNMISSPGSGKTSLLEALGRRFGKKLLVITGDIQTQIDKERILAAGAGAVQIETRGSCHLTAHMIHAVASRLSFSGVEYLVIENVGNLVCPSSYDLGEDEKMAVLSVAEGDEKPIKYPSLFVRARAVVINKIDLLPHVNFNMDRAIDDIKKLKHDVEIFPVSSTTGEGIDAVYSYFEGRRNKQAIPTSSIS
jgi:hydrogenase nickel incorporation protein HypB